MKSVSYTATCPSVSTESLPVEFLIFDDNPESEHNIRNVAEVFAGEINWTIVPDNVLVQVKYGSNVHSVRVSAIPTFTYTSKVEYSYTEPDTPKVA